MQFFAFRFRFKKLPHRPNLHELRGFFFHLFHRREQFHRLRLALRQPLFEIALVPQMPPKQHVRTDVAPHFAQVRNQPYFSIEISHRLNRQIHAHLRRTRHRRQLFHSHRRCDRHGARQFSIRTQHRFTCRRIHQLVHQAQSGHRVFRVAHRISIARRDFCLRKFPGQRGSAH